MGAESKEKASDSVKDNRTDSGEENNKEDKERISPPDSKSDVREAEENEIGEMILSYLKDLLDANKEENVTRLDKNDGSINTSEEKKETKGDDLGQIKENSEEKKETKWGSIDWSKDNSEEKKEETKWDNIDWSKDYSSEEKKIEGSKKDIIDDNITTRGEDNEKIDDGNLNEKKSDDEYYKKENEGINDNLDEKGKEHEIVGNNENDYESNLGREGTETLLFPSEYPEEQLERTNEYESKNNSEQLLERKSEEIDEFELVTPKGKPEKPAEPPEIMELVEEGSYNSDYSSEQELELSPEIEAQRESENPPEQETLNESEDKSIEELGKELELINPETGESIPPQPDWEFIPLQDYLEQLHEQQENRDEIYEIESEQEREKIPDQEPEPNLEQESEVKSFEESKNLFDQKSEFIAEQESEYRLNHNHIQKNKIEHITEKENDSITNSKESGENKHHNYNHLIKTKYEPIFSQKQLRKAQDKSEKSDKEIKISKKTKTKNIADIIKEKDLIVDSTLLKTVEESNNVKTDYSSEHNQRTSTKRFEKGENIEISKQLEEQKQEKLKENQKTEFTSSELLELQERYRQETEKRPIYNKKQTKGFKKWLENQKKSKIKQSQSDRKSEIREEWEILLQKWINEANERDISQKVKKELLNIIKKYRQCQNIYSKLVQLSESKELTRKELEEIEKFIQKLEETTDTQIKIFKNLRAFRSFYKENIKWYKHLIDAQKQKFLNHLSQKLNYLKELNKPQKYIKSNWKKLLNEYLYKNTTLNYRDKSLINKILQKEKLTEHDKKELISLLSKLSIDELISILGYEFKCHTQNYVKWGWDYDQAVKKLILNTYLTKNENLKRGKGIYKKERVKDKVEDLKDKEKSKVIIKNRSDNNKSDLLNISRNTLLKENSHKKINYYNDNFRRKLKSSIEVVAKCFLNKYDLKSLDKKVLINLAFRLFDYAVLIKGMKPNDLGRNKGTRYLSIILIYYALITLDYTRVGSETLTGKLVAKSVKNYSELGFNKRVTMENKITVGKFYKFLPQKVKTKNDAVPSSKKIIFDKGYRYDLERYLDIAIPQLLHYYSISELNADDLKKYALKIYDFAVKNNIQQKISSSYNSNRMCIILLYYAFLNLGIKSVNSTSIGQADISRALIDVYDKLDFSDINSMLYLRPGTLIEFLPKNLKNLVDTLPSPKLIIFNQSFKEKLKNYLKIISKDILTKYSISAINENNLVSTALDFFDFALEHNLSPDDLKKNRAPNKLALILIYFALVHYGINNLGNKMISANLIIDSINNFTELDLANRPNSQINPSYILPFLPKTIENKILDLDNAHKIFIEYNEDFKKKLENYVKLISTKILNTGYTEEIKVRDIVNESLKLFNDALKKGLNSNSLGQFRYARFISICLVYFSLVSLGITSLGHGSISLRDISDIMAEHYKDLGFGSHKSLRFGTGLFKEYLDQDIINKIKNMPATHGIVFNSIYFDRLRAYLNFVGKKAINYYNLSMELDDLVSRAIKIFNDCILIGLEPSDMGINKSESFMSIILIYYSLISFKILKLKSERIMITKIIDDLLSEDYGQIGFSSFWFSIRLSVGSVYAYLPKYVKEIVDMLPERDFSKPKGKYESICKRAFDEFFSNFFKKKIKFIPHLELFKLVKKQYNRYLENYIRRAHIDGVFRINLPKDRIRQLKHNLKTNFKIPKTAIEKLYIIKHLNDSNINDLKDKIKDDFLKDKPKFIKIQFPFGYIRILLKNSRIYLIERFIDIPFTYSNSNVAWIVFEYNGSQHYIFPNYYQKDFNQIDRFLDRLIQDLLKFYLFSDNGAINFEFPYWIDNKMISQTKINNYIKAKVKSFFIF